MDAPSESSVRAREGWPVRGMLWTLAVSIVVTLALQLTPRGASTLIGTISEVTEPNEWFGTRRVRVQQYSRDFGWPLSSHSMRYADWTLTNQGKGKPAEMTRYDFGEVLEDHPFLPGPGERLRTWNPSYIAVNFAIIVLGSQLIALAVIARRRQQVRKLREANRCIKCGYYLIGVPVPRCPECGWPIEP